MVKKNEAFTNFAGGQYSPHLAGRYDSPLYRYGVESALNVLSRPQGGFIRRPGSTNIDTYNPTSRGIAFNVSPTEAYLVIIEPGDTAATIKILQNDTLVKTISSSDSGILNGAIGVQDLDFDYVRNIMVFTRRVMHPKVLRAPTTTEYEGDNTTTDYSTGFPYFDATNIIVKIDGVTQTITTDYTVAESELIGGQYSTATITFGTAPSSGEVIEIIRDWEYVDYPAIDGPWETENTDPTKKIAVVGGTGTIGEEISGTCNVYATNRKGTALKTWFDDNWVGRKIRLYSQSGGNESYGSIMLDTIFVSGQSFQSTISSSQPITNTNGSVTPPLSVRTRRWSLSAWYENNYPEKVAFHEGRLYFFRDNDRWATVANDLFTLSPDIISGADDAEVYTVTDDSAIYFKSADSNSTSPSFAISHQALHLGTNSSHLTISGVGRTSGISPSNIQQVKESNIGTASIRPVIYDSLYFVDNIRQNLYKSDYQFRTNSYKSEKINNYDDEILYPRIKTIALLTQPFAMIWCVLDDGTVRTCTINEVDSVYTWTKLEFHAEVFDIMVLQTANDREQVYLLMQNGDLVKLGVFRTCQGETYRKINYRELHYLATDFFHTYSNEKEQEYLTDNNTLYSAGSLNLASALTGGKRAVDRTNYKQYKSGTGTVTVANDYEIGTPFYAEIILRPLNVIVNAESNLQKDKNPLKTTFNVWRTMDFKVKEVNSSYNTSVSFRDGTTDPYTPADPYTGVKSVKGPSSNKGEVVQLKIYQEECTPFNLNSVIVEYDED